MDRFDAIAPIDYRYLPPPLVYYLSENGLTRYKLKVELALVRALYRRGWCPAEVADEIETACDRITTAEVYAEEDRVKHDIRALVNCIQRQVSDAAKPFVHMTATSYDIIDTANAARYRDAVKKELLPLMIELMKGLINIVRREANTLQIGRTHGQHGVPITFGFAVASYVSRLGSCIEEIDRRAGMLVGKFSGAVGAYNASSLFFADPVKFEIEVLEELDLKPSDHSTQIVQPEPLARLLHEIVLASGVVANLARDMRHLQRTEIDEVCEEFGKDQVGSSTMAHKRNPINWENIESMWKVIAPRYQTVLLDTVSEHQRDLTGSASARTFGEIVAYAYSMMERAARVVKKLRVVPESMERNLAHTSGLILAEPLYLLLAAKGHPDAHEKVRKLSGIAKESKRELMAVALEDGECRELIASLSPARQMLLNDPRNYIGQASQVANEIARTWEFRLKI